MTLRCDCLPQPAPARVLALGAYLKNTACLVQGQSLWWSPLHGDLGGAAACQALAKSVQALRAQADGPIEAVAHDLHPDFESTRLAQALAAELGVPAVGVQHHHAHVAVVQAEQGIKDEVIGLSLDGVGLGTDGEAWGGELLWLSAGGQPWARLGHLPRLALPGGDVAAREPWRLAVAALVAAGCQEAVLPLLGPVVGEGAVKFLLQMLARGLNCPSSTGAGRWFDAAAGVLGLSVRQSQEAEAAVALEQCATHWREAHPKLQPELPDGVLTDPDRMPDLSALMPQLLSLRLAADAGDPQARGQGAYLFHHALAHGLALAARSAARQRGTHHLVLSGGCFFNHLLSRELSSAAQVLGLRVLRPATLSCGDAGLALGQAWVAAHAIRSERALTAARMDSSTLPIALV